MLSDLAETLPADPLLDQGLDVTAVDRTLLPQDAQVERGDRAEMELQHRVGSDDVEPSDAFC